MNNIIDILKERGFIDQTKNDINLKYILAKPKSIAIYVSFNPIETSLKLKHLISIMALIHMQHNNHKIIALIDESSALISTSNKKILSKEEIKFNANNIKEQLIKLTSYNNNKIFIINNIDWFQKKNYISFIKNIGKYFSIKKMIESKNYKNELASNNGLNFIKFNHMILKAYDFYKLYNLHNCQLQMGKNNQRDNIMAGINLVKKIKKKNVFGLTFQTISTSKNIKIDKTTKKTIWLTSSVTSSYDYYQFWVNIHDADVKHFMAIYTLLPMTEIKEIKHFNDKELNYSKKILAFEATSIIHGKNKAIQAHKSSLKLFSGENIPNYILPSSKIPRNLAHLDNFATPTFEINIKTFHDGIPAFKLFNIAGLAESKSSAKRLIKQGGGYINGKRINSFDYKINISDIKDKKILLRSGKKKYLEINIKYK